MPRNVRNFWIEAKVDGSTKPIAFGPQAADGGFTLTVYMRDAGGVTRALELDGHAVRGMLSGGKPETLTLDIRPLTDPKPVVAGERGFILKTRRD
jgi:hypothetical protein